MGPANSNKQNRQVETSTQISLQITSLRLPHPLRFAGNSDMGYSSMILDESAPNEVLASPELSPIRFGAEKSPSSDGDSKDSSDGVDKEGEDGSGAAQDHSQDTLTRRNHTDVDLMKHGQPPFRIA